MIPDFPKEKQKIMQLWNEYLVQRNKQMLGVLAEIPSFAAHEGDRFQIVREDGSIQEEFYDELSGEFEINLNEVPSYNSETIANILDRTAEDMATQMGQKAFVNMKIAAEESGNLVDAKGEPLSKEHFLKMMEKLDIEFNEKGEPELPYIVMHPDLWEAKKDEFAKWDEDEEFTKAHEAIINQKREEWLARESNRKLVD